MPIRSANAADIPVLMALARSAPSAAHWMEQQYENAVSGPDRITLVIEENSQIHAFLVARTLAPEWEIENIVTAAAQQRRGLATQLLKEIIHLARSRNVSAIFLEVRESNLPARSLYEKNGFISTGCRPGYYSQPDEDALLYSFPMNRK